MRPSNLDPIPEYIDAAPALEPSVVHTSSGRVRVHLPHWSRERGDELAGEIRRLDGVTHAGASRHTGNLLICFDAARTNPAALLAALPTVRLGPPRLRLVQEEPPELSAQPPEFVRPSVVPELNIEPVDTSSVVYMTGVGRVVYKALGWTSVGLAVVGAITPGIPTAPFVVLAGYFFVRSSPEAHQWLRQSRWFGPILRDWEDHRGIRRSVRNVAAGLIVASMGATAFLGLSTPVLGAIWTCQLIGLGIVLSLRVVEPSEPVPATT
jgi:uncharacterized membrane protein YbaN (DUF454 family)